MPDKLNALMPKIEPLLRRLSVGTPDSEIIIAVHLAQQLLAGSGLDIHDMVERFKTLQQVLADSGFENNKLAELLKNPPLSAGEMQSIYDKGYADGHAVGAEQGRRSAVIAAAMPIAMLDTSDVGPGVNGYSWLEIAHYCADNKHRVSRDRDREFIDSVFEQLASGRRPISPPQAKWLRDIFKQRFAGRID
jgi:hypothetical protein